MSCDQVEGRYRVEPLLEHALSNTSSGIGEFVIRHSTKKPGPLILRSSGPGFHRTECACVVCKGECARVLGGGFSVNPARRGPPGPRQHLNTTLPTTWKSSGATHVRIPRSLMHRTRRAGRLTDSAGSGLPPAWPPDRAGLCVLCDWQPFPPSSGPAVGKWSAPGSFRSQAVPRRDSSRRETNRPEAHPPERPCRSG